MDGLWCIGFLTTSLRLAPYTLPLYFINFNNSICNDTVHFPGGNCSVAGEETYPLDLDSCTANFTSPSALGPIDATSQTSWKTGPLYKLPPNWTSTPQNPFAPGYTELYFTNVLPTSLVLQLTAALVDNSSGRCIGGLGKDLSLEFITSLLSVLAYSIPMLSSKGRIFVYEQAGILLVGASHGNYYRRVSTVGYEFLRITPAQSEDPTIAKAGSILTQDATLVKFTFDFDGATYEHISQPLVDSLGLQWGISVVISLTMLFKDVTASYMRMLAITAGAIVALSVAASLSITFALLKPINELSLDMWYVSEMRLELVQWKPTKLKEISEMQGYFAEMVTKLKEYRTFLPMGILKPSTRGSSDSLGGGRGSGAATFRKEPTTATVMPTERTNRYRANSLDERTSTGSAPSTPSPKSGAAAAARSGGADLTLGGRMSSHINKLVTTLSKRVVSCLVADIVEFHGSLKSDLGLVSLHTQLMEIITKIVQECHGMCNPFLGDKVVAFWNVKTVKSEHAVHCVTAALEIQKAMEKLIQQQEQQQPPASAENSENPNETPISQLAQPKGVRLTCTTGFAHFGPMGTRTARAFTVISPCVTYAFGLQKLLKLIPVLGVICDGTFQRFVRFNCVSRVVAHLYSNHKETVEDTIHEILAPVQSGGADEWMYELQQKEVCEGKFALLEKAIRDLYCSGALEETQEHLNTFLQQPGCEADRLALWYRDHLPMLSQWVSSRYGLMCPVRVLVGMKNCQECGEEAAACECQRSAGAGEATSSPLGSSPKTRACALGLRQKDTFDQIPGVPAGEEDEAKEVKREEDED